MTAPRLTGADQSEYFGSAVVYDTSTARVMTTAQPIARVTELRDLFIALLLQLLFEIFVSPQISHLRKAGGPCFADQPDQSSADQDAGCYPTGKFLLRNYGKGVLTPVR